jgi:hypothetical protein
MPDVGVISALTFTATSLVSGNIAPAGEASTAGQVFDTTFGFWISDPLVLPGTPVTASVIRWQATVPAGATATFETSINGGASWDPATNNAPIPRLRAGDTLTRAVLTRVTLTRGSEFGPKPAVTFLQVQVSCDASTDEYVPLAFGVIDKVTVTSTTGQTSGGSGGGGGGGVTSHGGGQSGGGTSIKIHAVDLSHMVKMAAWEQPFFIPTGLTYGEAAKLIISDRLPFQTEFRIATTEHLINDLIVYGMDQGGDPMQDVIELCAAAGCECFFDPTGAFVFRPIPDPRYGTPVWEFNEDANPVVTEAKKDLDAEPIRNFIVVKGESTATANPVSAFSFDNDPNSATRITGKLGKRTARLTFANVTTQEQAQAAADGTLYNSIGMADQVTITCVPMPALEPGDIPRIKIGDVRADGTYLINSVVTPLSPAGSQEIVAYRQAANPAYTAA